MNRQSFSYQSFVFIIGVTICFAPVLFARQNIQPDNKSPDLDSSEIARIATFRQASQLADNDPARTEYIQKAHREFGNRGPALARYFLNHQRADNSIFFFLFEAVGNTETAQVLIRAIPDPPIPVDMELSRHAGEIEVAVEQVLKNENVRQDSALLQALKETLSRTRSRSADDFTIEVIISLIGNLKTQAAVVHLQTLMADPNQTVRRAAADALGRTGFAQAGRELERSLMADQSPEVRTQAAEALADAPSVESVAELRTALETESDPASIDAIIRSLTRLEALPDDPKKCLRMAARGWDANVVRAPFRCWLKTANEESLIETATESDNMAVRSLALTALTTTGNTQDLFVPVQSAVPEFEASVQNQLLTSVAEILSYNIFGIAEPATISSETAWLAKEALWNIADRNMALALDYAGRIGPLHYGKQSTGRYGAFYHLANKDQEAFSVLRRPYQWLAAGFLALLSALLLIVRRLRPVGLSMLTGSVLWAVMIFFENGAESFPPAPLWYLTVSGLAFISAGIVSGIFDLTVARKWVRFSAGPVIVGIIALGICFYTRSRELFPADSSGWSTLFDPIGCALIAIPASFILLFLLSLVRSRYNYFIPVSGTQSW